MLDVNSVIKRNFFSFKSFLATILYIWNLFFFEYTSAECREEVKALSRNLHKSKVVPNLYIFENDTQKCDEAESLLVPPLSFCDSHDLIVNFFTVPVLPNGTNM